MARIFIAAMALWVNAAFATGHLTVESSPNGAEVWYTGPDDPDRKYLGDTPLENRELPTGRYNLWLILSSHDTLAVPEVVISEGQHTLVNREIPTFYGYLGVVTIPDSAQIWLDGVMVGNSPYENNLMLPGDRRLKVDPRPAIFRSTALRLPINKGDTIRLSVQSGYRTKTFGYESLSLNPWQLGVDFGILHRTTTGEYDSTSHDPYSNSEKRTQVDFPVTARLGLPQGFEVRLQLPFKTYDNKDTSGDRAVFQSNLIAGLKYTYLPYNVGADVAWGFGFKNGKAALPHDFLALTLLGMASKGDVVLDAQAGYQFNWSDKEDNEINFGDEARLHARLGYLLDPWMPYFAVFGKYRLESSVDGITNEDGGYLVTPELGFTVDIDDFIAFQAGVPFTILGKRDLSYWGIHGSVYLTVDIL